MASNGHTCLQTVQPTQLITSITTSSFEGWATCSYASLTVSARLNDVARVWWSLELIKILLAELLSTHGHLVMITVGSSLAIQRREPYQLRQAEDLL